MTAQIHDSAPPGQYYCATCEKNFAVGDRCPTDGTRLVKIMVPLDPLLGRDLDHRYTILEKLGQGGMGAVYRGSQHGLGREVAIKVVSAHLVSEPDVVKRFLREAKLASRLSHPNAVAVLDFGQTEDGIFYLVMELVSGRTLDHVLKAEHQLKHERVARIGMQVCDALEGAHNLSIVHRDLKPANIMLLAAARDLVKVLDFGLAKSTAPDQTNTTMTNAGALLGTPAFMSPELALGEKSDGRSDLYSLGVVLFLAGSGRLPFISESAHELIAKHGTETAPPMTGVPQALANVIDRMLAKDPNARYQNATENREALEAALDSRFSSSEVIASNPYLTPVPPRAADFASMPTPSSSDLADDSTVLQKVDLGPISSDVRAAGARDTIAPRKPRSKLLVAGGVVFVAALGSGAFVLFGGSKDPAPSSEVTSPSSNPTKPDVTKPDPSKAAGALTPDSTKTGSAVTPDSTKTNDPTKLGDATKSNPTKTDDGTPTGRKDKHHATKATTKSIGAKPTTKIGSATGTTTTTTGTATTGTATTGTSTAGTTGTAATTGTSTAGTTGTAATVGKTTATNTTTTTTTKPDPAGQGSGSGKKVTPMPF